MIAFDLQCANGHKFEGWFDDGQAFEDQKKAGLVTCPVCEDTHVTKAPTTFAISRSAGGGPPSATLERKKEELSKLKEKFSDFIEENFENVGTDFTKEALKIHYGVSEPRNIRGVSTTEDEKVLKDEGVDFHKLPIPVTPKEGDNKN